MRLGRKADAVLFARHDRAFPQQDSDNTWDFGDIAALEYEVSGRIHGSRRRAKKDGSRV